MQEMVKRVRDDKSGFTLAELLIVVAIIGVLVAIAVPIFSGALGQAEAAVQQANQRAIKAEATTKYMLDGEKGDKTYDYWVTKDGDIVTASPSGESTKYFAEVKVDSTTGDITVTVTPDNP